MNLPEFKHRVDEALRQLDRSEAWLARQMGYTAGQFSKWMAGINRIPYEAVIALGEKLDLAPLQQLQLMDLAGYPPPRWARLRASQSLLSSISSDISPDGSAGGTTREFATADTYLEYMHEVVASAHESVDDLSWGIDVPSYSQREEDAYFGYVQSIEAACRRGITYREVMSFRNSAHFVDRAVALLDQNLITYNLRYYDIDLLGAPPLIAMMIIDRREALMAWYRWPYLPPHAERRIATRQPAIVALLADYVETVWFGATKIKTGDSVDWTQVEKIKRQREQT